MSDKLKSALELALEKLDGQKEFSVSTLTEQQKGKIAEVRKKFQARIAEAEIGTQSKLSAAVQSNSMDQIPQLQERLSQDKARLNRRMEREVEKIRNP